MRTTDLDFELPEELIAQNPPPHRSDSRLLHYRREDRAVEHRHFSDLLALLRPGDLLVFNDARVLPARISLRKASGGYVEGLFLAEMAPGKWRTMLKNVGTPRPGLVLTFMDAPEISMSVLDKDADGHYLTQLSVASPAVEILNKVGRMPLPPYIRRDKHHDQRDEQDRQRYQTVYAHSGHAVAAPTAGLHFTDELLAGLKSKGIKQAFVTLNVGLGTFKPVTTDNLEDHAMHSESYTISQVTAEMINQARSARGRVIAVGTTSARVLESQETHVPLTARTAQTNIFIYPPYQWKYVDALITNFHLPKSTLIALVAALVGLEEQRRLYTLAIQQRYRFFSYGDAMFIE